jgi:hypothetical protein
VRAASKFEVGKVARQQADVALPAGKRDPEYFLLRKTREKWPDSRKEFPCWTKTELVRSGGELCSPGWSAKNIKRFYKEM